MRVLARPRIVLVKTLSSAVTGSIAAERWTCEFVDQKGYAVNVVMTADALQFVTAVPFKRCRGIRW
jgi:phosphopantothenoylcysteine synthetase/decarboxylase